MALIWTDFNNGETISILRAGVNTFNNAVVTDVNNNTQDIVALKAPNSTKYTPLVTPPSHVEGQVYYNKNSGSFRVQGPLAGVEVDVGHSMHIHVVNNSGVIIEKGMAVRHNGVDVSGNVQVTKAQADSFDNARIFGVAQEDITNGSEGAIVTLGEISGIDTSLITAGVPVYLSDTVAGTWTTSAPTIVSQVGGVTVQDAASGVLVVSIINNTNLPTIYGGLENQVTPLYSLTTTAQDIDGYSTKTEAVVSADLATGVITLPNAGAYRMNLVAAISFTSSTATRSVTFEVYDITGTQIAYSYVKNIPRDATQDGLSFSFPGQAVVGKQVKIRVKANTAMDITFDSVVFDIESVNIR